MGEILTLIQPKAVCQVSMSYYAWNWSKNLCGMVVVWWCVRLLKLKLNKINVFSSLPYMSECPEPQQVCATAFENMDIELN